MASGLYLLISSYLINKALSCTFYAERDPESLDEVARYPLGVCTGTHYFHSESEQESVMYLCSHDNSHIIKYAYTGSSKCSGEYTPSVATRDPNDFVCDSDAQTCPYVVVKTHNIGVMSGDEWRRWYSSLWITDHCNNGELYSCNDNTGYTLKTYENSNCDGSPIETTTYPASEYVEDQNTKYVDVFCNEPDPIATILTLPKDETVHNDDPTEAIETAVCLNGRRTGKHREIGNKMVSYCFYGYDAHNKPIYKGEYAEIHWTKLAGSYGNSYGLFLYGTDDEAADGYPIAHCFGDSNDISVCSQKWYFEHGTTPKYYLDSMMEVSECECSVDTDKFKLRPPAIHTETSSAVVCHAFYIAFLMGFIQVFL